MRHGFVSGREGIWSAELPAGDLIAAMLENDNVDCPFFRVSQLMRHRPDLITVVTHPVHLAICLSFSPSTDYSSRQLGT